MNYRLLLVIPLLLLIVSSGILFLKSSSGTLDLDIDFKGGTQLTAETKTQINAKNIENILKDYNANVRTGRGFKSYTLTIEFDSDIKASDVIGKLVENGYDLDYSIQTISPSLGESFFKQSRIALTLAFIFMGVVVFILFKKPLPSIYVILAAFADIVEALVFSQLFGIKLSLATFAALLLTLGYSVDTDILLTTRVLKREGELNEKIKTAFNTGITMSTTTLAAMTAMYFLTTSIVIKQIASILLIALIADLINTWMMNAVLLRWYVERRIK